jgi:hypothetical protein
VGLALDFSCAVFFFRPPRLDSGDDFLDGSELFFDEGGEGEWVEFGSLCAEGLLGFLGKVRAI